MKKMTKQEMMEVSGGGIGGKMKPNMSLGCVAALISTGIAVGTMSTMSAGSLAYPTVAALASIGILDSCF